MCKYQMLICNAELRKCEDEQMLRLSLAMDVDSVNLVVEKPYDKTLVPD